MPMVVQHNMSAINANNKMNVNVAGLKKSTEKLSSGYQINRAGDNAAGLAISEKMRSQIRGLSQATKNAQDGISLIQTAEGGLNETHSILQRMRELAVQSANGTYTQEDRDAIQLEADALKSEIDRISTSTEFNTQQLLDGSLNGAPDSTTYGAKFGVVAAAGNGIDGAILTSSHAGVKVLVAASTDATKGASGKGGENAVWNKTGKTLTLNLVAGETYTQKDIDKLIADATWDKGNTATPPEISLTLKNGVYVAKDADDTGVTVAGTRTGNAAAVDLKTLVGNKDAGALGSADQIKFTANTYGATSKTGAVSKITITTDVAAGKETVKVADPKKPGEITLQLATGVDYTEKDIADILAKEGYDFSVDLSDSFAPDGDSDNVIRFNVASATGVEVALTAGVGVGKEDIGKVGEGLTFQIGANGVEDQRVTLNIDDMGSASLGVANVDVSTRDKANEAINTIDSAISKVSMQRAGLGALQNRLEYTVNNLTTTNENLTNAESTIRDTDMATEMISYTKFNILQQASQAMLAQANQQPQAVLQLLG